MTLWKYSFMSKKFHPLIPHASVGGKFSFISIAIIPLYFRPGDAERGGNIWNAAGVVVGGLVCGAEQLPFSSPGRSVSVLRGGQGDRRDVLHGAELSMDGHPVDFHGFQATQQRGPRLI